jgi:hypothetical protein
MSTRTTTENRLPNGPAAAALLAGGIGAAVLGVVTTLSEVSTSISNSLNWTRPVGPLSGKVGVTVILYVISWLALGFAWKGKNVNFSQIATIAFILLAIGLLGTFPPVFDLIAGK